jgi:type IV secretory pathway VirB2 component (pilin)
MKELYFYHLTNLHYFSSAIVNCDQNSGCDTGLPKVAASSANLQTILQLLFGALGSLAVLMILIGGIQFIISGDNPQDVSKARQTIIYALVGLLLAISAELIVTYILTNI